VERQYVRITSRCFCFDICSCKES